MLILLCRGRLHNPGKQSCPKIQRPATHLALPLQERAYVSLGYFAPNTLDGKAHDHGNGTAGSALPYRRAPAKWVKATPEEVADQIFKLAKKGMTPSQIGIVLRDSHGIAQVKSVTGNKILRILKSNGRLQNSSGHFVQC